MKINNKRKLQNIAINHSADIDYKGFTESVQKNLFLTITTLPAINPLRFRKTSFHSFKNDSKWSN